MDKNGDAYQSRMLRMARIRTLAVVISMAMLLAIGYFALLMGSQLKTILDDAKTTFQTLNTLSKEIEATNIPGLFDSVNGLVGTAQKTMGDATDGVEQAVQKIEELDITTLNKAITDLSAIVEPLASLFSGGR